MTESELFRKVNGLTIDFNSFLKYKNDEYMGWDWAENGDIAFKNSQIQEKWGSMTIEEKQQLFAKINQQTIRNG